MSESIYDLKPGEKIIAEPVTSEKAQEFDYLESRLTPNGKRVVIGRLYSPDALLLGIIKGTKKDEGPKS